MVYLLDENIRKFLRLGEDLIPRAKPSGMWKVLENIYKVINCYYKSTFGTFWVKTTFICCGFFFKFLELTLRSRNQLHLMCFGNMRSKLML